MNLKDRLTLEGRLDRTGFARSLIDTMALAAALVVGVIYATIQEVPMLAGFFALLLGMVLYCMFSATVRRLHDRGLSGGWCIVLAVLQGFSMMLNMVDQGKSPDVVVVQLGLSALIVVLLTQTLICSSQPGANRFGPGSRLPSRPVNATHSVEIA